MKEKIDLIAREHYKGNNSAFAIAMDTSEANIRNYRTGKSQPKIDFIVKLHSKLEINFDWLLEGFEGSEEQSTLAEPIPVYSTSTKITAPEKTNNSKLSNHQAKIEKGFLPLIPIEAVAGFGKGDVQVSEFDIYDYYEVPIFAKRGAKFLIQVSGNSMYPKYSNGDLLACKPIQSLSFVQWGKPYVLDTEQGGIVKRLYQNQENQEVLICHSDNKEYYPAFEIPLTSIYSVAIVVGLMRSE